VKECFKKVREEKFLVENSKQEFKTNPRGNGNNENQAHPKIPLEAKFHVVPPSDSLCLRY
jgi:hypothetical protein